MKIWTLEENAPTHRLVSFNLEQHSDYQYIGDLNDDELKVFFLEIKPDLDVEENTKMLKYFGYLHLFVVKKK